MSLSREPDWKKCASNMQHSLANCFQGMPTHRIVLDVEELATDNAEDFKQGAKIDKASVSRRERVGTLLKIPLC